LISLGFLIVLGWYFVAPGCQIPKPYQTVALALLFSLGFLILFPRFRN